MIWWIKKKMQVIFKDEESRQLDKVIKKRKIGQT